MVEWPPKNNHLEESTSITVQLKKLAEQRGIEVPEDASRSEVLALVGAEPLSPDSMAKISPGLQQLLEQQPQQGQQEQFSRLSIADGRLSIAEPPGEQQLEPEAATLEDNFGVTRQARGRARRMWRGLIFG